MSHHGYWVIYTVLTLYLGLLYSARFIAVQLSLKYSFIETLAQILFIFHFHSFITTSYGYEVIKLLLLNNIIRVFQVFSCTIPLFFDNTHLETLFLLLFSVPHFLFFVQTFTSTNNNLCLNWRGTLPTEYLLPIYYYFKFYFF